MATYRERNNLASKKSYEKELERKYAVDYEYAVIERHRQIPRTQVWHWSVVPEDHLFEAGYIHDFSKHRLMRLMNKKRAEEGENRLRDYGLDGLAMTQSDSGEVVYHGIQAKYYQSRQVTAGDIGSFLAKQISMTGLNPLSRGYLYTTSRLQADLADEVAQPTYPIRHILFPWKHPDHRVKPATASVLGPLAPVPAVKECDLPLREYQADVLAELIDGRNAICIPCRMGKTLIAGHWVRRYRPRVVLAIAPLKLSVENLQTRLACFLPHHRPLLVDSDYEGTTDEKEVMSFLEENEEKEVVVYSTFDSAMGVLSELEWEEGAAILVDEAHNATTELCEWIQGFRRCLVMSATFPDEICEEMGIEQMTVVPFSKGIEGGYIVDYTLWLPSLTKHADGTTSVEAEIPVGFEQYERSMVLKALYHTVCMLRTGSRRTIVYLGTQAECDMYMEVARRVFEDYHGLTVWMGKITSEVGRGEREALLRDFQAEGDSFRILTSVRILDEAIDVPACDSVFITTVGEHTSDIRFFQRAQRSGTLDPKNPNKRNHIFLWAEGWEKCVEALTLLRTSDPEFHRKVRHIGVEYDKKETVQEEKGRRVKEQEEFTEWSRMACETVEERVRRKAERLLAFVEREGRIPKFKEVVEGVKLGQFWSRVTQGNNSGVYRTLLSHNPILRQDYERVQQLKEEKKGKMIWTPNEKAQMLLAFVEKEGSIPKRLEEVEGVKLRYFWNNVTQGKCSNIYQTLLSHNPILRQDYERVEQLREEKKGKEILTLEEKARRLLVFVEREGKVPKFSQEVAGVKLGHFWNNVTQGKCSNIYQTLLSHNPILRQDYERVQQLREEKKEKVVWTPNEKAEMILALVEKEGRVPKQSEEVEGAKLGVFWNGITQGKCSNIYQTLLTHNPILRQDYKRVEQLREDKKGKEILTPKEKARRLLAFVEKEGRIPKQSEEVEGAKLGVFWNGITQGKCSNIYQTLLSHNPILREGYERVQQRKEEKKEKGVWTPNEKAELLLAFVEREGRIPKQSEEMEGVKLGHFWNDVTQGHNSNVYQTILSRNPTLRQDYERVEQLRGEKKGKMILTPNEKAEMLLAFVEKEERVPKKSEEVEGVKLRHFWNNVTQGQCSSVYQTLLSHNPILRQDYERVQLRKQQKDSD